MKLRDGSQITDRRVDRLLMFDDRSKNFPVSWFWSKKTKKPRSYTWRCNAHFDQGAEGACVGFGVTHELCARPAEVQGLSARFAREQIYWEAQRNDPWDGGSYPGAVSVYEGTAVIEGIKAAHKLRYFDSYRWAFGLDDLILGVGYNGPAVMGLNWYQGMGDINEEGFIKPIGKQTGGHCILCSAVNVKEEYFRLHNSWGQLWGINGDCLISFKDMEKLLKEDGEAVFLQGRHSKI